MRTRRALAPLLFLSFGAVVGLRAQQIPAGRSTPPGAPGRISGTVVSAGSSQPLPATAITVRSAADSAFVAGVLTSPDGKFRIEGLPFGRYSVRLSHVGYKSSLTEIVALSVAAPRADLGTIEMVVAPIELAGLEAQAARAPVVLEADRTVYNTKDMPAAAGTVIDVLRAVPELDVDIHGKISLRGNQAVAIHLNGRPAALRGDQLTNFLQQLPGKRVAKIEVMPNPSAKHDPEGMGGIVNLVLQQNIDLGT
ncbi:MAG: carboxypeptidase regulatory-like domain-containing protein, partial [Longimicrobiales bacterium]